jgi:hypothetical protein
MIVLPSTFSDRLHRNGTLYLTGFLNRFNSNSTCKTNKVNPTVAWEVVGGVLLQIQQKAGAGEDG